MKYTLMSRKSFDKKFDNDKLGSWTNMGGYWSKKDALKQMKDYKGEGKTKWGLVPPQRMRKNSGGYYNVLFSNKQTRGAKYKYK